MKYDVCQVAGVRTRLIQRQAASNMLACHKWRLFDFVDLHLVMGN